MMILVHKWSYLRISNIRNIADGGGKCEPTQQIIPEIFATSRFHDNATKINVPPHRPRKTDFIIHWHLSIDLGSASSLRLPFLYFHLINGNQLKLSSSSFGDSQSEVSRVTERLIRPILMRAKFFCNQPEINYSRQTSGH